MDRSGERVICAACQLLLVHTKLESTVRYLSIDPNDALVISGQTDI